MLLSQRNQVFFFTAVWIKRLQRITKWYFSRTPYALTQSKNTFPFTVFSHQTPLIRRLEGVDEQLQHNKVKNLKLASACLDGIVIHPGETFSFYRLVGFPHRFRGFLPGMELNRGKVRAGIGGGLCQIANLLHWMALHSPLTVKEHHHHSFDIFPDDGRIQPFGSGATLFYNYLDYQLLNETPFTFQLSLKVDEGYLKGQLLCSEALPAIYEVFEKNHAFIKQNGEFFRTNEIWRMEKDSETDEEKSRYRIKKNWSKVMYIPKDYIDKDKL